MKDLQAANDLSSRNSSVENAAPCASPQVSCILYPDYVDLRLMCSNLGLQLDEGKDDTMQLKAPITLLAIISLILRAHSFSTEASVRK